MPYFYNNDINILFIHIPKTGGTSLEKYFEHKYKIELNKNSLYTTNPKEFYNGISCQHQLYKTIKMNKQFFRIDYSNIKFITVVRNPYNRIISDLLFKNIVKENFTQTQVYEHIKKYLEEAHDPKYDNHRIPQYLFLLDENDKMLNNIKIMKTETLNDDIFELFGINNIIHNNKGDTYDKNLSNNGYNNLKKYLSKDYACIDKLYELGILSLNKYNILSK